MSESTQCPVCVHYQGELKCAAFPNGIPQSIITGRRDHSKPYPGDNGIRFQPVPEEEGVALLPGVL